MAKYTIQELHYRQSLPLSMKVAMTKTRIRDWISHYGTDGVYIAFSGGKDSTVLSHLVDECYPNNDIPRVFVDTGLEYPEIREFAKKDPRTVFVKPKMNFREVINKYGYPFISKEVSECVYGAKKYLTSLLEENSTLTDRQTDRQTDRPYSYQYRKLTGTGEYSKFSKTPTEIDIADERSKADFSRGGTITSIENSEELANILRRDFGKKSVIRTANLLGMLTKDNQIKANIPNKDRSMFSQQKWQFFLDDGAPNISHLCCNVMKKEPSHRYAKETGRVVMTGQTASESRLRTQQWLKNGCNAFDNKNPVSNPLSVWTEQDVLLYIKLNNIEICSVYGEVVEDSEMTGQLVGQMSLTDYSDEYGLFDIGNPTLKTTGCDRTGCMFCGFGAHCKGDDRFVRMKETHPKTYDYVMRPWEEEVEMVNPTTGEKHKVIQTGLNYKEVIDWINEHGNLNIKY